MQHDPTDIASELDAEAAAQAAAQLAREVEREDIRWLMGFERGRRIAWRALERAGVFRSSFSTDALAMAFAEGRRNEGLRLLADLQALAPDAYLLMIREAKQDESADRSAG